jgi:hypothetical protein
MRTDDLIAALVADRHVGEVSLERRFALAMATSFAVSAVLFFMTLGPRDDLMAAIGTARFDLKIIEALLLAITAAVLALRLARPGLEKGRAAISLLAVPALLAMGVAAELLLVPAAQWQRRLVGSNSLVCLTAIPLLALPVLAAALYVLHSGAPTRPTLAGAAAGLLAGGSAAVLYATHCTDDSPLFVATWYSLAIALVSLVGAAAGKRLLRW